MIGSCLLKKRVNNCGIETLDGLVECVCKSAESGTMSADEYHE